MSDPQARTAAQSQNAALAMPPASATTSEPGWLRALDSIWRLNRVHVGPEMAEAYRRLADYYPVQLFGFESGARSGSWIVPPEWRVSTARLHGPDGRVIADWSIHPLHLYAYSPSFHGTVTRQELESHLTSDPERPDAVPFHFRNQYRHWTPEWGFCLPHSVRTALPDGAYSVEIATEFRAGRMEMAEQVHAGEHPDALLLIGHFDHPAMCNDGLVGCLAGHEILSRLSSRRTRLTYRMLSTVEIVGSVFYAERYARANSVREGLFVACPGARAPLAYQTTALGTASIDRIARHVLAHAVSSARVVPFRKLLGNDEIAFDVGGVEVPCGSFVRFPFAEYHTDGDTPEAVDCAAFEESIHVIQSIIDVYEHNALLMRRFSGLPCLSNPELDLYLSAPTVSGVRQLNDSTAERVLANLPSERARAEARAASDHFFDLMNLVPTMAEGNYTTLDLAERAGVPFALAHAYVAMWMDRGLLQSRWVHPFKASR